MQNFIIDILKIPTKKEAKEIKVELLIYDNGIWDFQYIFSGCSSLKEFIIITRKKNLINKEDIILLEPKYDNKINYNYNNDDYISIYNPMSDENNKKIDFNFYYNDPIFLNSTQLVSPITNNSKSTSSSKSEKKNIIIHISNIIFMFYKCFSLTVIKGLSLFDISNVTDISGIFEECISLESLPDISKWNTNKANNISRVFFKLLITDIFT